MGNKIGRRRQVVDEKYTKPQGLYQHRDIDHKKLRKLILDSKLAPCYLGEDDPRFDLEGCPICFLHYPSLNRSRCCMKGICTECFLQMKPPHSTRPTQCPFCKTSNYAVEYRGVKTKEEKGIEQVEEQKFIEAQIRMRQQEIQDAEERTQKRQDQCSSSSTMNIGEIEYHNVVNSTVPSFRYTAHGNDLSTSQGSYTIPTSCRPSHSRQNREGNFDLDLDDIMIMEAIWLSIQEGGNQRYQASSSSSELSLNPYPLESSPSGGLACTVAALAERQHLNDDASSNNLEDEHASNVAEVSTSYASSAGMITSDALGPTLDLPDAGLSYIGGPGNLVPETYEEQVMLAMAVSLADARGRTTSQQGVTWM